MDDKVALNFRRQLRLNMPEPERILWYKLRELNEIGKFRRQHCFGNYIVDFYCAAARIVIEIDGDSHYSDSAQKKDEERDAYLSRRDLLVLRFTNHQVMHETESVLTMIIDTVRERSAPHPSPLPASGARE